MWGSEGETIVADNYLSFSERIDGLTPAACEWVETVLSLNPDESDEELKTLVAELGCEPSNDELEELVYTWPHFEWKIQNLLDRDGKAIHNIWLYTEEWGSLQHVKWFVQALIHTFMPDYIFTLTFAETCSKPRLREFGGGWLVISKDETLWGDTWREAESSAEAIRARARSWIVNDG